LGIRIYAPRSKAYATICERRRRRRVNASRIRVRLEAQIETFGDFRKHARRLRAVIGPHVIDLLRLGVSVVLDSPPTHRSLFETAKAEHELHVIEATDELCKARLRKRNETMPEGLYFGHVSEDIFDPVTSLLAPPSQAEGFNVVRHRAG
jgi:hypothetical protein